MTPANAPVTPRVGRVARLLGGAGLLPQFAAVVAQALSPGSGAGAIVAFGYASLILSFLGGVWWGFAMRRGDREQGGLAVVAVIPSLVPVALAGLSLLIGWRWTLVALGVALMLTLLVDGRLADRGDAPAGWMTLRVPLSSGLALLTLIVALIR